MTRPRSSSSVAAEPAGLAPVGLAFGPPLGPTEWEDTHAKNHCQVCIGRKFIGMLFLLSYPEIEVEHVIVPLSESYRFQPLDHVPLPMLISSTRQTLIKELEHYVALAYPAASTTQQE